MTNDQMPGDWVIVAGGFHDTGAMDRANAALATHLLERGARIHLVGHDIDARFTRHRHARCHVVPRPTAAPLAESLLSRRGLAVAGAVTAASSDARVVVNGGNCPWPDINWVHAVHAVWPVTDVGAPAWIKVKHRAVKALARRQERTALRLARLVFTNSLASRQAMLDSGLLDTSSKVHVLYLGIDASWANADVDERNDARAALQIAPDRPVVAYVGTLGFDLNKGFDVIWSAWERLMASGNWNASLIVAGGGARLPFWRRTAERARLGGCVKFLGHTSRVREVLTAADLLVSPVRYEAYGMNVHEALCRGAAVMVTRTAGIAERFDGALQPSLLPPDVTSEYLQARLREWSADVDGWRIRAQSTAARLRSRSWDDMARDLVALSMETAVHSESRTTRVA
jgi:glycosyltransferase involved in cell wall biosynthesis